MPSRTAAAAETCYRAAFDDYKETCDDTAIGGRTRNGLVFDAGGRARNGPVFLVRVCLLRCEEEVCFKILKWFNIKNKIRLIDVFLSPPR